MRKKVFKIRDLQENKVSSKNQNDKCFYALNKENTHKILFVGNSITKHAPKPEANWYNDCGMAATKVSNDYVHILMKRVLDKNENYSFAILQVADFERDFENFNIEKNYYEAKKFKPDIIVMFFGANVIKSYDYEISPNVTFKEKYKELRDYLATNENTLIIHSEGFFNRKKINEEKKSVAEEMSDIWIDLGDIVVSEETHDMQFNHPNDLGMIKIADKFWNEIKKFV